jgi:2-dehydropantoate 2-reductase
MRVLIMGSGGVGGYYGGLLANHGTDVTFVARGAHLAALQSKGLELRTQGEVLSIAPVTAVEDPRTAGPFDLILFTVKTYDTASAIDLIRPVVGPSTIVLTLQNGIDAIDLLGTGLGAAHVLGGVTFVACAIVEPGVLAENGFSRRIALGEPSGGVTPRVQAIVELGKAAGWDVSALPSARQAVWEKFVLLAPHASVSALCQQPIGEIRQTAEAMQLYRDLIAEVVAVGNAEGVTFPAEIADTIVNNFMGAPPGQVSSLQRDYAAERRVELEYLTGAVIRRAHARGIAIPRFDALYAVLKVRARAFGGLV